MKIAKQVCICILNISHQNPKEKKQKTKNKQTDIPRHLKEQTRTYPSLLPSKASISSSSRNSGEMEKARAERWCVRILFDLVMMLVRYSQNLLRGCTSLILMLVRIGRLCFSGSERAYSFFFWLRPSFLR